MKLSTKAALLSGLVFPGVGHLVSRTYIRAGALAISASVAMYVILSISVRQAMLVVDQITSGEVPLDSNISELIAATSNAADDRTANFALLAFGLLWLIGIVDSWRLGAALDEKAAQA